MQLHWAGTAFVLVWCRDLLWPAHSWIVNIEVVIRCVLLARVDLNVHMRRVVIEKEPADNSKDDVDQRDRPWFNHERLSKQLVLQVFIWLPALALCIDCQLLWDFLYVDSSEPQSTNRSNDFVFEPIMKNNDAGDRDPSL